MSRFYTCDLHNHTCLSPCALREMQPEALVQALRIRGVDIAAVTDHNATENIHHVMHAARGTPLVIIPGMEVTTSEEVHVLALCDSLAAIRQLQELVYRCLPGRDAAGSRAIDGWQDDAQGCGRYGLFTATDITTEKLTQCIHACSGLAIASHIDRTFFSIISQLGSIPPGADFDALEISATLGMEGGRRRFPGLASSYCFITSSDAHCLDDVGRSCTRMYLETPCFSDIKLALAGRDGRYVTQGFPSGRLR